MDKLGLGMHIFLDMGIGRVSQEQVYDQNDNFLHTPCLMNDYEDIHHCYRNEVPRTQSSYGDPSFAIFSCGEINNLPPLLKNNE